VTGLAVGTSAFTFLLEPQGKVSAWGRITRLAADAMLFDVAAGFADVTIARLTRFKLRTKADIERLDWRMVAVRGDVDRDAIDPSAVVAGFDWPDFVGVDLLGADVVAPTGIVIGDRAEYER